MKKKQLVAGVDYVAAAVTFFCHDGNGRVAMHKRGQAARDQRGRWDIGGGQIDWGDSPEKTLAKEITEEFGARILDYQFLGYRSVVLEEEERPAAHWLMFDYKVRVDPAEVYNAEPHKHDALEWFPVDGIPSPCHVEIPHILDKYQLGYMAVGTRIRFTETLEAAASGDHPHLIYALDGEEGVIVGHAARTGEPREGYWVRTDSWPERFGASYHEFIVL